MGCNIYDNGGLELLHFLTTGVCDCLDLQTLSTIDPFPTPSYLINQDFLEIKAMGAFGLVSSEIGRKSPLSTKR